MKTFYTYLWLREDGTPYYVGKGSGRRAFVKHGRLPGVPPKRDRILIQEFPDESSALDAEVFLILLYGRIDLGTGCLRNRYDGGTGVSGRKNPQETLELMSLSATQRWKDIEARKKQSAKLMGRKFSLESIRKMSEAAKLRCSLRKAAGKPGPNAGRKQTPEWVANNIASRRKVA